jgi:hypothetical protein
MFHTRVCIEVFILKVATGLIRRAPKGRRNRSPRSPHPESSLPSYAEVLLPRSGAGLGPNLICFQACHGLCQWFSFWLPFLPVERCRAMVFWFYDRANLEVDYLRTVAVNLAAFLAAFRARYFGLLQFTENSCAWLLSSTLSWMKSVCLTHQPHRPRDPVEPVSIT